MVQDDESEDRHRHPFNWYVKLPHLRTLSPDHPKNTAEIKYSKPKTDLTPRHSLRRPNPNPLCPNLANLPPLVHPMVRLPRAPNRRPHPRPLRSDSQVPNHLPNRPLPGQRVREILLVQRILDVVATAVLGGVDLLAGDGGVCAGGVVGGEGGVDSEGGGDIAAEGSGR